ncbi:MAG: DUF4936 family protein [Rhodocyclaceae bacterium]
MISGLYIYYCVAPEKTREARSAVLSMLEAVKSASGVQGRLLCRMEDCNTWMEVYDPVDNAGRLLDTIDQAVRDAGVMDYLLPGTRRHTEQFVPHDGR